MAQIVSPLITGNPVLIKATGYVKGSIGTYNGIFVISSGPNGQQVNQQFKSTGAGSGFWMDWAMVDAHTKYSQNASGQGAAVGSPQHNPGGGGTAKGNVTIDQSVYNYIMDYYAANG